MHQTIKIVFRTCFAAVIFIVTFALFLTCFAKFQEILQADHEYTNAQTVNLKSDTKNQFVLVSNNQSPDNALFLHLAGQGYVAKIKCDHYSALCTDEINQSHTRQVQNIDLLKVGTHWYIQKVDYRDSRTQQKQQFEYSLAEIKQFYDNDISNLKYVIFGIALFALAALFVSIKIIKNFRRFLNK
jgi:hypothetical protein